MDLEEELRHQTEKMLREVKGKRQNIRLLDHSKKDMMKNIDAYISDTSYFLGKKDFIRAFEAVVWCFAWMEIMEELKILRAEH
jgi:hypothetical protein